MDTDNNNNTTASVIYTPREAILHSATLLTKRNTVITVRGTAVLVDPPRNRLDISHNGAKLIVRLPNELPGDVVLLEDNKENCCNIHARESNKQNVIQTGTIVEVKGMLRKEQRRTFLLAVSLSSYRDTTRETASNEGKAP